jgi:hypothetical protein
VVAERDALFDVTVFANVAAPPYTRIFHYVGESPDARVFADRIRLN